MEMNSSTNITPSREWISLKDSQPYAHLVEKILLEWISASCRAHAGHTSEKKNTDFAKNV